MTNVRLKEVATKATKTDFYNQFFTAARITSIIGYFGQLISALTEFHFIFSIFNGSYNPFNQYSNILPFIGGLLGIYIFEYLGVRIYLVRIIRQIVNKDFQGSERKVLFTFNLLFVIALCGSNLLTSWLGQKYSFDTAKNVRTTDKTHGLEIEKTTKIEALTTQYNKQLQELTTQYNNDKNDIKKRYDSDIKELKNSRWTYRDNETKYNSYTAQIDSKLKAKTTDLSNLKQSYNKDKTSLKQALNEDKTSLKQALNKRINDISKVEHSKINLIATVQKYTLPILIVFILLSWCSIVYNEIFIKGSGQKIEVKQIEKRPILITVLLLGLYEKLYQLFYYITARIVGTKKYQFSEIKQDVVKYDISQLNIKKQPVKIAAKLKKVSFIDYENNTNDNDIVNVSNEAKTTDLSDLKQTSDTHNVQRYTVNVEANNDTKTRYCKNCNKMFSYKHWNARYCSDKCRIESWEKRTGKKLKKKSKK